MIIRDTFHPENGGRWTITKYAWACSVCGFELRPMLGQTPEKFDRCPFCSARMDEGQEKDLGDE